MKTIELKIITFLIAVFFFAGCKNPAGSDVDFSDGDPATPAVLVESVSAGSFHTMIVKTDETLWATGWNDYGQLGDGTNTGTSIPIQIFID